MAKYLKLFETEGEYDSFAESDEFILPNVSFIERSVTIVFNLSSNHDPYNGHEYVDLGLPSGLKWAKCNIGAEKESDYGLYFQWGDIVGYSSSQVGYVGDGEGKKYFGWSDYKYCNGSSKTLTKYNSKSSYGIVDNLTTLEPSDDAASVIMGGSWRMPSNEEYNELLNNTTNTWTIVNGVNGWLFTGNNGSNLFLPAAGECYNSSVNGVGFSGNYWSSSLNDSLASYADILSFTSNYCGPNLTSRYRGLTVRGVMD